MPPKKKRVAPEASVEDVDEQPAAKRPKRATVAAAEADAANVANHGLSWEHKSDYYWVMDSAQLPGSAKIASFDMDHTLIKPKSKGKFPTGRKDWEWFLPGVPAKLQELHKYGFKIVVFTNQGGIEKNKQKVDDLTWKLIDISAALGFPIQAFIAGATDHYRKPNTTMWQDLENQHNKGVKIDMKVSYFVGDAAGRPKGWKAGLGKDFSCTDRKFAFNNKLTFYTPEEFFLGEKPHPTFDWDCVDPEATLTKHQGVSLDESKIVGKTQELVVMVAAPASGKSTLVKRFLIPAGYEWVNRDTLGTPAKCAKAVTAALEAGKSVVVDNTNPSVSARGEYLRIAKAQGVTARVIYLDTPREIAEHQNFVRERMTDGAVRRIPDVGYNMFYKNFEEPTTAEGFNEVLKIKWAPHFASDADKQLFLQRTG